MSDYKRVRGTVRSETSDAREVTAHLYQAVGIVSSAPARHLHAEEGGGVASVVTRRPVLFRGPAIRFTYAHNAVMHTFHVLLGCMVAWAHSALPLTFHARRHQLSMAGPPRPNRLNACRGRRSVVKGGRGADWTEARNE